MKEQVSDQIKELYIKQYDMLLSYAMRKLKNDDLAEEAVQETFRIACQKADVLYKSTNKEGWLLITLKNVILNIKKIQWRSDRKIAEFSKALESFYDGPSCVDLDVLYKDLASTEEYILIKEMVLEQKSICELSESRGISIAACKKRVQRAKEVLRKRLKEAEDS